jgi:hypothetical protein
MSQWSREMDTRVAMARRGYTWQRIATARGLASRASAYKSVRRWLDAEEWQILQAERRKAGTYRLSRWYAPPGGPYPRRGPAVGTENNT